MADEEKVRERKRKINKKLLFFVLIPVVLLAVGFASFGIARNLKNGINDRSSDNGNQEKSDAAEYDVISGVYSSSGVDVVRTRDADGDSPKPGENKKLKEIYLTFDDGPSSCTNEILDILDKYQVKATFFVQGKEGTENEECYKRIVRDGHTLAMHSYTHNTKSIYSSVESFSEDLCRLQDYLYDLTGVWSRIYRFPGGSSNTVSDLPMSVFIDYLDENDITYFDWNVSAQDAVRGTSLSPATIYANCIAGVDNLDECVILIHDSGARHTSVEALELIIPYYLERGDCVILPITDETVPVCHRKGSK